MGGGAFLVASVGWRAIPTRRPAATQGQGGTVPPPPPPTVEPPFLVQARSTPVAPHTFTKTNVQPYLIEVVFSKHPKHSQCCSFSWVFASIFPPSSFFVLGKWLRRKWFNRHRMPPMCRASNPEIYSSQFRIFTNIVLCFLLFFCFVGICLLIMNAFISSKCFFSFKNKFANSKIWMIKSSCRGKHVKNG